MRILLIFFLLFPMSCTQQYRVLNDLLVPLDEIVVPFEQRFLGYSPDMMSFAIKDSVLMNDTLPRIVFTGSSSIRMWKTLAADLDTLPFRVLNRGFGGSRLPEVNYFYDDLITPHQPEIVVLYCGENDIHDGASAEDVYQAFRTFLKLFFQKSPQSKLLFLGLKPSPSRWASWPEFDEANKKISRLIRKLNSSHIRYLDVGELMIDNRSKRPIPEIFVSDSLHMSEVGYARWTPAVIEEIEAMYESYP